MSFESELAGLTIERRTILVVLGTRPEAIKLAPVIAELRGRTEFRTIVCSTGQHREMLDQALSLFEIEPDIDLKLMRPNQKLVELTTAVLLGISSVIDNTSPDFVIVQGDTTTAMAGALAASYAGVPIGHVEAGLRTFDRFNPFPEENNRVMIDSIADLLFAPTQANVANLINMGVAEDNIFLTGNTVVDAALSTVDILGQDGVNVQGVLDGEIPEDIRSLVNALV